MSDLVLRPLDRLSRKAVDSICSPTQAIRSNYTSLDGFSYKVKTKVTGGPSDTPPRITGLSCSYRWTHKEPEIGYSLDERYDGSWNRTKLETMPLTACINNDLNSVSSYGPEISVLGGYTSPHNRSLKTAEYWAKKERSYLRQFHAKALAAYDKFSKTTELLRKAFYERKSKLLSSLNSQLSRLQNSRRKRQLYYLTAIRDLERTVKILRADIRIAEEWTHRPTSKMRLRLASMLERLVSLPARRDAELSRIDSKIAKCETKIVRVTGSRFTPKTFRPKTYIPKYFNLRTGAVLVKTSLPFNWKDQIHLLPVSHVSAKRPQPSPTTLTLSFVDKSWWSKGTFGPMMRETSGTITWSGIMPYTSDASIEHPYILVPSRLIIRNDKFSYDESAVRSALASLRFKVKADMSLPTMLFEAADIPRSVLSLFDSARSFVMNGNIWANALRLLTKRDRAALTAFRAAIMGSCKSLSGADLNRKFGVNQAVSDFINIHLVVLEHLTKNCAKLESFLKNRGKVFVSRRRIRESTEDFNYTIPLSQFFPLRGDELTIGGERYVSDEEGPIWTTPSGHIEEDYLDSGQRGPAKIAEFLATKSNSPSLQVTRRTSIKQYLTIVSSYSATDAFGWDLDEDEIRRRWCLDRLGIFADPGAVWDVIPFSFVIDWLYNVKSLLTNLEIRNIRPSVTIYGTMLSQREETVWIPRPLNVNTFWETEEDHYKNSGFIASNWGELSSAAKQVVYKRQEIAVPDTIVSGMTVHQHPPNWWQLVTGLELLF